MGVDKIHSGDHFTTDAHVSYQYLVPLKQTQCLCQLYLRTTGGKCNDSNLISEITSQKPLANPPCSLLSGLLRGKADHAVRTHTAHGMVHTGGT